MSDSVSDQPSNRSASSAILQIAGILGVAAVALGAFGAHGLKGRVDAGLLAPALLDAFKTGVQYHFYHVLALTALALADTSCWTAAWLQRAAVLWVVGIGLFSGSLYAMTFTGIKILGAITPFGGVSFILGWCALVLAGRTARR